MPTVYTWSDLRTAQRNLRNENSTRTDLVDKRDRLESAYSSICSYKSSFEEQKNIFTNSVYNGDFQWKGEVHDLVAGEFGTFFYIYSNYNDLFNRIDTVLDDINTKRLELDLQIDVCDGNIAAFQDLINIITTYLDNLTN
ncbi:protein of unknown function [Ruminococcaceae bacterium KH2T8]|nr:protein of unknown function [Ruminococcaceae bacterium KH2T8]